MTQTVQQEKQLLPISTNFFPIVSIVMPFEPKMTATTELEKEVQQAVLQVKTELENHYSHEETSLILSGLKTLTDNLNYSTYRKSIAIFVSPTVNKVYYLNIQVDKNVAVDKPFEMRDLIDRKRQLRRYAVLVLSDRSMKMFLGDAGEFQKILSYADSIGGPKDVPDRMSGFYDASSRREIMSDKFIRYADQVVGELLKAYPYPLFVLATPRTAVHFRKITTNNRQIVDYIYGNFEDATDNALAGTVMPCIKKWEEVKQVYLLNQLSAASGAGNLAIGMEAVYKEASARKGQLLVVERNCTSPLEAFSDAGSEDQRFYIKDAIDEVIGKVVENGGDVEFVPEGVLMKYRKIALIKMWNP